MNWFDTHAHLPSEFDGDTVAYYQRALDAGVTNITLLGSGTKQCDAIASFSDEFRQIYFAAGIHPHDALSLAFEISHPELFEKYVSYKNFVAIGEIGLDYYYDFTPRFQQIDLLKVMLDLAIRLHKPAVIHCRDKQDSDIAYRDAYQLLKPFAEKGGRFVLHSFAGTPFVFNLFRELDPYFGVCGMVTFRNAENIRQLVKLYPYHRILLETDSPYLTPVPLRGQVNHPANITLTASYLAALLNVPVEHIAEQTVKNSFRFFEISS